MSYNIETRQVSEFVKDNKIKLPRFQRKSTWDAKQNFELAISIFQEYPVGVVIINNEGDTSWLLDGRQRRNALMELRANPNSVYDWARSYIRFKATESEEIVRQLFWGKVDAYLETEKSCEKDKEEEKDNEENENSEIEYDIDKDRQRDGLNTLLGIILMVHQKKKDKSGNTYGKWERIFNLSDMVERLPYATKRNNYRIDGISLRSFILDFKNKIGNISKENFLVYLEDNVGIKEDKEKGLIKHLDRHWEDIQHIINVIKKSEQIFEEARIGVIFIKNVTALDAQNIFSRINKGGTQLKAEELLSAKPFWNERVNVKDSKISALVKDLYERLGVEIPKDGMVVRWDYGATLLSRIKDGRLLFDEKCDSKADENVDMTQISLGFKMISSRFLGGMSASMVNDLEKSNEIVWGDSIDELVDDVNQLCKLLLNNQFFKYLQSWGRSIYKLLGSAIVLEFITIILKDWKEKGSPTVASNELNIVLRDAKILFERLVFEYSTGIWRGSGDSKMAKHIENWHDRIKPVGNKEWSALIEGACEGIYNGQSFVEKSLTPILYYQYVLRKMCPPALSQLDVTYEVDHIIPQAKLKGNVQVPAEFKDSLVNLALLPKSDNISKKDKALNEISDKWLRDVVSEYTGIDKDEFDRFSDISHLDEFRTLRKKMFIKIFEDDRNSALSN